MLRYDSGFDLAGSTIVFGSKVKRFAGGRGRAQPHSLPPTGQELMATLDDGRTKAASELVRGDVIVIEAGQSIPADGRVIEGIAMVDESAITGESAPVIRESAGDRSEVTHGTQVLTSRIVVEVTRPAGRPGT